MIELNDYLLNELKHNCNEIENKFIEDLIECNFCDVLDNQLIKQLLIEINCGLNENNLKTIEDKLCLSRDQLIRYVIYSSISCLQLYVFNNFINFIENDIKFDNCLQFINDLMTRNDYKLDIDGEECYSMARSVSLLKSSRFGFIEIQAFISEDNLLYHLWRIRSAIIHQISVTFPSNTLFCEILSQEKVIQELIQNNNDFDKHLKIQLFVELLNTFLWFKDIERVKTYSQSVEQLSGLTIELSGALGVRTQYQQKPVSQLRVKINRNSTESQSLNALKVNNDLPKNVVLNDDTLLQSVKFMSLDAEEDNKDLGLTEVEQTLMLSFIKSSQMIGSTSDELLSEEIESYLEFLIQRCNNWSILMVCLLLRSLLQKESRRRVERSMTQINELVDCVRNSRLNCCKTSQRLRYFYSVLSNPFWILERHLAEILVSLGVTKSALDIYLRLNLWEEIIQCYHRVGRRDKAEAIIRDQLKTKETPYLYCLLGDATDDMSCYEKSWELSEHSYPRAQKSLGNHYFQLKQYSESISYFKRSVDLNSMQTDVWFRLAFAAMTTEDYELAASAYRRVLQFEANSFEAWNNLSKAYILLGQKWRSFKTLQEAIKCNYNEWKIWDNYIAVCVDVGAFSEAIHAWHRLIDIKGQYIDDKVAKILVNAICGEILDRNNDSAARLASKAQELFGRVGATSNGSTNMWRLYAKLLINNKVEDMEKVIQCLQKCHRNAIQSNVWHKNSQTVEEVLRHCLLLAEEYNKIAVLDETKALRVLSSSKLAINSVTVLVDKNRDIWSESDRREGIEKCLNECKHKLQSISDKMKEIL